MAAPTVTLLALSPNRGKITVVADASGDPGTILNADLLAAFPDGTPLGELVRKTFANSTLAIRAVLGWSGFVSSQNVGRLYPGVQRDAGGVSAIAPKLLPNVSATLLIFDITTVAVAGTWDFYIEQIPSLTR